MDQLEEMLEPLLGIEILGTTLFAWITAAVLALVVYFGVLVLRSVLARRMPAPMAGQSPTWRTALGVMARETRHYLAVFLALGAANYALHLPPRIDWALAAAAMIAVMFQIGRWGAALVTLWTDRYVAARPDNTGSNAAQIIKFLGLVAVWSAVLLLALSNLGVDITALVAGLGIGGIAVAFALQNILGDLFASLAIVLDRPFEVGEFIIFGDELGTVEQIGIKTTRLRSLSGEQISVSNTDLLNSRIHNYTRMRERRVVFNVTVVYQTPPEKLEAATRMIREAVERAGQTRFDRSHFVTFEDSALRIETVYYVLSPDYNLYMDIQQKINLDIYRRFAKARIDFAYPTRTLYVESLPGVDTAHAAAPQQQSTAAE